MTITLKYFGLIAEITNKKEELFSIEKESVTIQSLRLQLEGNYPGLQKATYKIAVNQSMANETVLVNDNDEIALLPPFAGG